MNQNHLFNLHRQDITVVLRRRSFVPAAEEVGIHTSQWKLLLHQGLWKITQMAARKSIPSIECLLHFFFLCKRTHKLNLAKKNCWKDSFSENWEPHAHECGDSPDNHTPAVSISCYFNQLQVVCLSFCIIHPPYHHFLKSHWEHTLHFEMWEALIGNTKCAFLNLIPVDKRPSRFQVGSVHQN